MTENMNIEENRDEKNSDAELKQNSSPAENTVTQKPVEKKSRGCMALIIFFTVVFFIAGALAVFFLVAGILLHFSSMPSFSIMPGVSYSEEYISGDQFSGNKIVVVDVNGVILNQSSPSPVYSVADAEFICDQLKYIANDKSVKAVIMNIDSPGGEVVAADNIHHHIKKLRKENNMPVIASMNSLAASGGYYISAPCSYIIANRLTLTGSIGVIIETYKYYDLFNKIGVRSEVYKSGPMKDILDGSRPSTEAEKQVVQKLVNESYNEFVKIVAEGRKGLTVEKIKGTEIGDGRVFSGEEAFNLGLVDKLGFFEDAVNKAAEMGNVKGNYKLIRYNKPFSFSQLFSELKGPSSSINLSLPGTARRTGLEAGKMYFLPPSF